MADDKLTPPREPDPPIGGFTGAAIAAANLLNRMTQEKILLVTVVAILAFFVFDSQTKVTEREQTTARRYDESREQDRRHCDDREDLAKRERAQEAKDLRAWFAGQAEMQRRHDAEREEKLTKVGLERDEKLRSLLTLILNKLENLKP